MAREITIVKGEEINIKYENNSDFDLAVRVTTNDGSAYSLTGKTIRMDVKENRNNQTYLYRLVSGTEITISDTNLLTWSKVMELPNETYHYDVYIVDDTYYTMRGLLNIVRNVTT